MRMEELIEKQSIRANKWRIKKRTWGSPGGTVMQLVHPWRSSAVIRGRILTATRTHCVESAFLPPFISVCSIFGRRNQNSVRSSSICD